MFLLPGNKTARPADTKEPCQTPSGGNDRVLYTYISRGTRACFGIPLHVTAKSFLVRYRDLTVPDIDFDDGVTVDMAVKDGLGKKVDKFTLHQTLDRTGTVGRLIALGAHVVHELFREGDGHAVFRKLLLQVVHLQMKNVADILL